LSAEFITFWRLLAGQFGLDRTVDRETTLIVRVWRQFGHNWAATREAIHVSIDIEQLRSFQTRELEQKNMQTDGKQPVFTKTIEWSLVEIVILLTEIRDSINSVAGKS
jgi:hypothetical protein